MEVKRKSDNQGGLRRNGFARVTDEWVNAILFFYCVKDFKDYCSNLSVKSVLVG